MQSAREPGADTASLGHPLSPPKRDASGKNRIAMKSKSLFTCDSKVNILLRSLRQERVKSRLRQVSKAPGATLYSQIADGRESTAGQPGPLLQGPPSSPGPWPLLLSAPAP